LWYPDEGPSSTFVLSTPATIKSSSRRQEDSTQRVCAYEWRTEREKDTADAVVVMVTEVRRLEDSETAITQTKPIGLPLTWSGSNPPLTVGSVHPGSERHVDLLHVDWPARDEIDIARKWSENAPVQLDLTPRPAGGQEILDSGTYEISLEVRGKWSGKAAMWDHLRVEPPREVR
jgi:hypothetical protein